MKRFAVLALPALAVVLALMAVSATRDSASAQVVQQGRVTIECTQTQDPAAPDWIGEVTCTITVDAPTPPGPVALTLIVLYEDVDQSGNVTFGDQLVCWEVQLPDGSTQGTC